MGTRVRFRVPAPACRSTLSIEAHVESQEELAAKLKAAGFDYSQQIISDYMRNRVVDGEVEPRVVPRAEFFTALDDTFQLTDTQWKELAREWLALQPADRQEGYRRVLSGYGWDAVG